jgi:inhibitor of KinA
MSDDQIRIFSLGDSALTVEFGNTIAIPSNEKAIALSKFFEDNPFPGFIESVPAYASTSIFYDLNKTRKNFSGLPTAFEAVKHLATNAIESLGDYQTASSRTIEIPVHFDQEAALDLDHVAHQSGLAVQEVIELFVSTTYRVFMLGFLPGFTYLGEVDDRIATPRKETPRLAVPKGSVGIAGKQTGIYSLASPGGWQIIGRTDIEMFTPSEETPSFLRAGDMVKFVKTQ